MGPPVALGQILGRIQAMTVGRGAPEVTAMVRATPEEIFEVLSDGWLYALWVVGASHIRGVDAGWPAVGTRIHHGVGPWPLTLHDATEVLSVDPPYGLELMARSWPAGSAWIAIDLRPRENGSTEVRMRERVCAGPGRFLPDPVQHLMFLPRNTESLSRLADIVVGRAGRG